tara:strand:- start:2695 stop:2886 length:192 start_codon:yes stop_codon:yes gene_type:complete
MTTDEAKKMYTIEVVFTSGKSVTVEHVIGYGPTGEHWNVYVIETADTRSYLNFAQVQTIEVVG